MLKCFKCGLEPQIWIRRIEDKEEKAYCYGCFYDLLLDFAKYSKAKLEDMTR